MGRWGESFDDGHRLSRGPLPPFAVRGCYAWRSRDNKEYADEGGDERERAEAAALADYRGHNISVRGSGASV